MDKLLGEVKVEWKSLMDVCDYVDYRGKTPKKTTEGVFLVTAKNIRMNHIDYNSSREFISNDDYNSVMRRGLPEIGDILITTEAPCGFVAQVNRTDIALAQRVIKYRSKNEQLVTNAFLKHYLIGTEFQRKLHKAATGSTVKGIKGSKLHKLTVPIPPLKAQKEIVRILDIISKLTTELTAKLTTEYTDRKKQYSYYLNELFSFENEGIERKNLIEIGEFQRGKRFVKTDMISEGIPCIHYGEIYTHYDTWATESKSFLSEELVENKKLRIAERGDVVIVAAGETIEDIGKGTAWLGNKGVVIHDACFSYRSPLNPKYVAYFTRTKHFHDQIKKHISSGKISAINAKGLGTVVIPVPSAKEQERIVTILDKFDILNTSIRESLPKEIELRKKQYKYYRDMLLTFPKDNLKA